MNNTNIDTHLNHLNEKFSKELNFLFYKSRNLRKTNIILGTWIFRNELYIKTIDNKKINITCIEDLINFEKSIEIVKETNNGDN